MLTWNPEDRRWSPSDAAAPTGLSAIQESHRYFVDAVEVPSVTGVIDEMGLIPPYPDKEIYKRRGTAVHKACALFSANRLDMDKTDSRLIGYVISFRHFLKASGFQPLLVEHPVFSRNWKIAGTLDYYGTIKGKNVILDLKSGEPADASCVQTAGYAMLLQESDGLEVEERYVLRLDPDGKPASVRPHENHPEDTSLFQAAVLLWHWKKRKGIR